MKLKPILCGHFLLNSLHLLRRGFPQPSHYLSTEPIIFKQQGGNVVSSQQPALQDYFLFTPLCITLTLLQVCLVVSKWGWGGGGGWLQMREGVFVLQITRVSQFESFYKKMHHHSHHYTFTFSLWLRYDFEWDKFGSNCCKQCCSNVFVNNNLTNNNNQTKKTDFEKTNNKQKILKKCSNAFVNNLTTKYRVFFNCSSRFSVSK